MTKTLKVLVNVYDDGQFTCVVGSNTTTRK